MPPASNTTSGSKSKINRFSTSPDSEPTLPEPEIQPLSSKKKKKNAANRQAQSNVHDDRVSNLEITREESPAPARPQTILSQIPHGFSIPTKKGSPLSDVQDDELTASEKASDQYTPPNDTWLEDKFYGKSPPADPRPAIAHGGTPLVEPGFSTRTRYDSKSPPISPPTRHVRPLSYGGGIPPIPAIPRASPSACSNMPSTYGSPPAPHLPQQHFYHAQDIDLGLPHTGASPMKEEPSLVKYTSLPSGYGHAQQGILLGFDGRLNILRLESGTTEEIGLLDGLPGIVVDAALLGENLRYDAFAAVRPLVAIVIHGPREMQDDHPSSNVPTDVKSATRQPTAQQSLEYTTRVEIFSLLTQQRLECLLETPSQMPQSAFRGATPTPPSPIGHLRVQAAGAFLTVASGVSGEVYVFATKEDSQPGFECIGKFWTMIQPQIQRRDSSHQRASDVDVSPADLGRASGNTERTISSINGRWLAISPAVLPSRPSLGAILGSQVSYGRQSGVEGSSAPTKPSITCEVDSPDADTLFSKVARGVAQEFVKGAKWLGDQGMQTWQSYWKKEQLPSPGPAPPTFSPSMYPIPYAQNAFPPTHGEASRNSKDPELVAIYDLQALYDSAIRRVTEEIKPLATFQPPRGCSYVSFAPHGLNLLTAGRKGDVQYIWDLMQLKHCRAQVAAVEDERTRTQPRVRQIAKYERLSGSTIVDVTWAMPNGSRFAVLTKNKTIHLFDLPLSAFRWPPPRSAQKSRLSSKSMDSAQHDTPMASGFFASAMNIANQAQPMIASLRGRAPSMGGGLAGIGQTGIGFASATGARGGKAVAAGLSKSLGAASETVNQIRHAGENRLHLKSSKEPLPGKVFWVQHGRRSILTVLETDMVKQYQVRRSNGLERRDRENGTVFAARKGVSVKFPALSRLEPESSALPGQDITRHRPICGFLRTVSLTAASKSTMAHPLSFAEIETNAPYQPFHSDRRIVMSVYADSDALDTSQLPTAPLIASPQPRSRNKIQRTPKSQSQWIFGEDIPTITLNVNKLRLPEGEDEDSGSVIYRETTKVSSAGDENMDQIVSTTRRRKVKKSQSAIHDTGSDVEKDDGFFEDDCDVLDFATDRV